MSTAKSCGYQLLRDFWGCLGVRFEDVFYLKILNIIFYIIILKKIKNINLNQ
jgi:hypothetical protein